MIDAALPSRISHIALTPCRPCPGWCSDRPLAKWYPPETASIDSATWQPHGNAETSDATAWRAGGHRA